MVTRALFGAVLFIVVITLGLAVSGKGSPTSSDISCKDCNVIIIGIDTLRADRVHSFGYPRETTPHIDALAAGGYSFVNAISASSWTVPAFMSVMTGAYPSVHKVTNKYVEYDPKDPKKQILSDLRALSPQIETLAQAMKAAGYVTGGFTGDAGVGHAFGYGLGFDIYTDAETFGGLGNSETHALAWLDTLPKNQKFFMFFHGYDLHGQFKLATSSESFVPKDYKGPYTGSPQEEAKLREDQLVSPLSLTPADVAFWNGLYDSKIRAADAGVGDFIAALDGRGLLKNTVIVVLSDHGEEWHEHGGIDHGHTLYDELVHVPVIVSIPGTRGGVKISAQVSMMDVAPTLVQMLGMASGTFAGQLEGKSLLPYITGAATAGRDVFIETDYRDFTHKRGVRTADGWKYIITLENGKEELYNLNTDPREKENLITKEVAKATTLKDKLREHVENDLHSTLSAPVTTGCLPVYPTECK